MAGLGDEVGVNEASGAEDLLSNWTEITAQWSEMFSWRFSCFSIVPRSGISHSGSQKGDFCRSDGKSLDALRTGEFLESVTMLLTYTELLHPGPLPIVCSSCRKRTLWWPINGSSIVFQTFFHLLWILYEIPKTRTFKPAQNTRELYCHRLIWSRCGTGVEELKCTLIGHDLIITMPNRKINILSLSHYLFQ